MDTIHFSDFSLEILGILLHFKYPGLLPSRFFYEKSWSNVCQEHWLFKGCRRGFTPQPQEMNTAKRNSETRILRKSSENWDLFPQQIWSCDRHENWNGHPKLKTESLNGIKWRFLFTWVALCWWNCRFRLLLIIVYTQKYSNPQHQLFLVSGDFFGISYPVSLWLKGIPKIQI